MTGHVGPAFLSRGEIIFELANLFVGRHSVREMLCIELELHSGPIHPRYDEEQGDQNRRRNVKNDNTEHYGDGTSKTRKACDREPGYRLLPDVADLLRPQIVKRCLELAGEALLKILADRELQRT